MHESEQPLHKSPPTIAVLGANYYEAPKGADFPVHIHLTWELTYYLRGHIETTLNGVAYDACPGMLIATSPRGIHGERADTGYANYFVILDAPSEMPWPRTLMDDSHGTLHNLCSAIVREWTQGSEYREEMLNLLTRQLDIALRRAHERQQMSDEERLVQEAEDAIARRFSQPITIAEIASEIGTTPSSLRYFFTRLRGKSPMEYLQQTRACHAIEQISSTNLPLSTIAMMSGYDSASHMSRHIRRLTERTPGQFRQDAGKREIILKRPDMPRR